MENKLTTELPTGSERHLIPDLTPKYLTYVLDEAIKQKNKRLVKNPEDYYRPEAIAAFRGAYEKSNIYKARCIDNLQWAKDFLDDYERKHGKEVYSRIKERLDSERTG